MLSRNLEDPMKNSPSVALPFALVLMLASCHDTPSQPNSTPLFQVSGAPTVVRTLAEWQSAIANAEIGGKIIVHGTIELSRGEEAFLGVADVTILAATTGSGLRGVLDGDGVGPFCLICLGPTADGATVQGLTLDGTLSGRSSSSTSDAAPLRAAVSGGPLTGVTFRDNLIVCDVGCGVHVFFNNAPDGTFQDNVLMGHPEFSAIQLQGSSHRMRVIHNWVENAGPNGGIRIRGGNDQLVVDNTIASADRNGIFTTAFRGTIRDNKILAITGAATPSCFDGTTGSETAGTANTWIDNQAPVPSNPVGICGPITP